jgi:hypothetical protein
VLVADCTVRISFFSLSSPSSLLRAVRREEALRRHEGTLSGGSLLPLSLSSLLLSLHPPHRRRLRLRPLIAPFRAYAGFRRFPLPHYSSSSRVPALLEPRYWPSYLRVRLPSSNDDEKCGDRFSRSHTRDRRLFHPHFGVLDAFLPLLLT